MTREQRLPQKPPHLENKIGMKLRFSETGNPGDQNELF